MPIYEYHAKQGPTTIVKGQIEANSETSAVAALSAQGIIPLSIRDISRTTLLSPQPLMRRRISKRDLYMVVYQMADLSQSGMVLHKVLETVSEQVTNRNLAAIIKECTLRVREGMRLSDVLGTYPHVFSQFFVAMIRAGETSGTLDKVLLHCATTFEREYDFTLRIQQALAYPVLIALCGAGTVAAILTFVIPRLQSMYSDMGRSLPFITQIVMAVSGFFHAWWWLLVLLFGISVYGGYQALKKKSTAEWFFDRVLLHVPIVGKLLVAEEMSRIAHSMALLLESGVPFLTCLTVTKDMVRSGIYRATLQSVHDQVQSGKKMSDAMKAEKVFPLFMINLIAMGEETGAIDKALGRVQHVYDKQVDATVKLIANLFEPMLVLIIGLVVGCIVISMLLPIFTINVFVQ